MLIDKKEKKFTRQILNKMQEEKQKELFDEVYPYLLSFYKNELSLYIKKDLESHE